MARKTTYDICVEHLYSDKTQLSRLAPDDQAKVIRIREGYNIMREFPSKKDREIIMHLQNQFNVPRSTAYDDLRLIKELLGSFNKQTKDWHRFRFNHMVEKAYALAEARNDPDAMQKAANTYAKYNQLDKEDANQIPWSEILVQPFVPSSDPSILGIKPIPNVLERIKEMKRKYEADIEDITYQEIDIKQIEEYEQ